MRSLDLTLRPKKNYHDEIKNYGRNGRNGKLISEHMIMIMIIFMMKVRIVKNKYMINKNSNTTTTKIK